MTDDELPEPVRRRLIVTRMAFDLLRDDRYDSLDAARADAEDALNLSETRQIAGFRQKRLFRISRRYEDVTGDTFAEGLERTYQELEEESHTLRMLSRWLL